jgi:2-C-methyl-D-erythritol 2,4-cyclodiphosphate synthase
MNIRVGQGYDVHQMVVGRPLIIGGVEIPSEKGALGHSDADVLIHAIMDAILGAAGLNDIGHYFPDTDEFYKGIDSKILLSRVFELVCKKDLFIGNIDSTICLQSPKIAPYIPMMKNAISAILKIDPGQISIKATTGENMGFVGRQEGIAAMAVVLLHQQK